MLLWCVVGVLAGSSGGLLVAGLMAAAKEADREYERLAEQRRWALLSPGERLEELRARALRHSRES